MGARPDIVGVVEAAYRTEHAGAAWLEGVARAAGPHLFQDFGGIASFFDRRAVDPTMIVSHVTNLGADPALVVALRAAFEMGTPADRDRSLRQGGPLLRLSDIGGGPLTDNPLYGPLARSIGFSDLLVLRAMNPDGTGAFFATPTSGRRRRGAEWTARWSQLSAHLAAGMRLQRAAHAIDRPADNAGAVFTPGGRAVSLTKETESARDLLRRAVTERDRARSRRGRQDERAALEGWRALVDGRWSLVDHFESDGKRHVLAVENAPDAPDPRALAAEERPVLHYVAMGPANKLIAYELGLPLGTVASRVAGIMRKLGVRTRVEIVDRYLALTEMEFERLAVGEQMFAGSAVQGPRAEHAALTPAEREVVDMVRRGLSNKRIAETRRCSPQPSPTSSPASTRSSASARAPSSRVDPRRLLSCFADVLGVTAAVHS